MGFLRYLDNIMPASNSQVTITLDQLLAGGFCPWDRDDPFPIWLEAHRPELEKKIVDHYRFRQIGFETPGRFKFELNKLLREKMPYYIKIWKTTKYVYNPIENYNMQEGATDKSTGSTEGTGENLNRYSDTPQGSVDRLDNYLTSATKDESKHGEKTAGETKHEAWRHGNIGVTTTQQMIEQERKATIDVDMMIVDECKVLFLGVY